MIAGFSLVAAITAAWMDKKAQVYSESTDAVSREKEEFNFRNVRNFPAAYWVATVLVTVFYSSILPFQNFCQTYIEHTYSVDPSVSGWYTSIISAVSLVVSPVLGLTLDRWGYRIYLVQVVRFFIVAAGKVIYLIRARRVFSV